MHAILSGQRDGARRLSLTRLTVGVAVLRYISHLPPSRFFDEQREIVLRPVFGRRPAVPGRVAGLKLVTCLSVACWTLGLRPRTSGYVASASFGALNRQVAVGLPGFWSYTTHLNLLLLALSVSDTSRHFSLPALLGKAPVGNAAADERRQSITLALVQLFVASTYTQAGLSKILHGGRDWVRTGRTVQHALAVFGTPRGRALSRHRRLMVPMSVATVVFEAGYLPALLAGWRYRRLLGLMALCFHGGVKRYMNISFWHLAWMNVPLFVVPLAAT